MINDKEKSPQRHTEKTGEEGRVESADEPLGLDRKKTTDITDGTDGRSMLPHPN
jgi:hypothetical protein